LLAPAGYCSKPLNEVLLWANDDSKGEISVFGLREGDVRGTKQTSGVLRGRVAKESEGDRLRGRGRINALVWREGDDSQAKNGLELVTAHGDGTVGVWRVPDVDGSIDVGAGTRKAANGEENANADEDENERPPKKRKKQDFNALVEGLTKMK
jgi:hypothetical protein